MPTSTGEERGNAKRRTCAAACIDEASCRMFLCARCCCQVLVCRRCDRGQVYCVGTCAQEARRDKQREARQRYQATPRGRVMHAERNRRYRARQQRVTDHGLSKEHEAGLLPGFEGGSALNASSFSRKPPGPWFCHHCGHTASAFLRLSALRPRRRGQIYGIGRQLGRPP
jgi:hypothetical protein